MKLKDHIQPLVDVMQPMVSSLDEELHLMRRWCNRFPVNLDRTDAIQEPVVEHYQAMKTALNTYNPALIEAADELIELIDEQTDDFAWALQHPEITDALENYQRAAGGGE